MTRFEPETLAEALLRPIAMAFPDGGVYVEFIAPDFRFVFALALGLLALVLGLRARRPQGAKPVLALLALVAASFVPWLLTSGNGRYFVPLLLLAGPLCIGLLQLVPVSTGMRLALALGMVACQGYLLYEISPWRSWTYVQWSEGPAFEVEVPREFAESPATYVGLANISYSLIAPRFHPDSRWINISSQKGLGDRSREALRTQAFLRTGQPLRAFFPAPPGTGPDPRLEPHLRVAIDDLLARQGLSLADPGQCRFLRSGGLHAAAHESREKEARRQRTLGFWVCPLERKAAAPAETAVPLPARTEEVFRKLEHTCPGLFPPGEAATLRIPAGALRGYGSSDMKLYVLNDGVVMYKYFRALNPEVLGQVDQVLSAQFRMDCGQVRGRSGLPWEREI